MSYGQYGDLTPARAGQLEGLEHNIEGRVVLPAAGIAFGAAVFYGAADENGAYAPDSTDASLVFGGVACVSHRTFFDGATGVSTSGIYPQKDMVNVVKQGDIVVRVPSALTNTANKPAYLIHLTTDADYGKFTTTAGTNYVTGAYFKDNPVNGLAIIEVSGIK